MLLPSRDSSPFDALKAGDERLLEVLLWDGLLRYSGSAGVPPLTQEELAERTGLSRNSIKTYLSTKLRPALAGDATLSLERTAGYALGVDFGGTHEVRVVLANLHGLWEEESPSPDDPVGEQSESWQTIETAADRIWKVMHNPEKDPIDPRELVGVGIGIPTPPVPHKDAEDPAFGVWGGWGDPGELLRDALERKWRDEAKKRDQEIEGSIWASVEFASENDTNLTAITDHLLGGGPSSNFSLLVKWQSGVRAALILDGHLYTGSGGSAGELTHVHVEDPERRRCGWESCPAGEGCLYAIAPIEKLAERAGIAMDDDNLAEALAAAANTNATLRKDLKLAAEGIGRAIAPLALGVSPEKVVIGGALGARVYPFVLEEVRKGVGEETGVAHFLVTNSTIRNRGTVHGAAFLALLKFGPAYLKRFALAPPSNNGHGRGSARPRRKQAAPTPA